MPFCNNPSNDITPGCISGNPLSGLCERACVQVNKVFDACLMQATSDSADISSNPAPQTANVTFVSANSSTSRGTITALTITPLADRTGYSRVQATIGIPLDVVYLDNGVETNATTTYTLVEDVVMKVPDNSVIPATLAATVNLVSTTGTYTGAGIFTITACVTVILKIEAEVELLIPTYGYCKLPTCQQYSQEVCAGVFDLPLFPTTGPTT